MPRTRWPRSRSVILLLSLSMLMPRDILAACGFRRPALHAMSAVCYSHRDVCVFVFTKGADFMNVRELVQRAVANYDGLSPAPFSDDMPDATAYLATPDRPAYALGWIVASAIVGARYADSGI